MEKKEVDEAMQPKKAEKLTYEQLENVCHQLSEQSRTLYAKLQESNLTNMFKRLDYLFAIIENAAAFNSRGFSEFVDNCVKEITVHMSIPEKEKTTEDNKEE